MFAAGAASAVVGSGILMPIKKIVTADTWYAPAGLKRGLIKPGVYVTEVDYSEYIPPERTITSNIVITHDDLLDAKYADAMQQEMIWEDQNAQRELGSLMAEQLQQMSQRKGFVRRVMSAKELRHTYGSPFVRV